MTFDEAIRDKDFQALPFGERQYVLTQIDSDYAALPKSEQSRVLVELKNQPFWGEKKQPTMLAAHTPGARVESTGTKVKRKAREAIEFARPTLESVGSGLGAIIGGGGALVAGQAGPQIAIPEEIATVPAAAATGGALGYALTKGAIDRTVDYLSGNQQPDLKGASLQSLKDVGTGYAGELLGAGLGAGAGKLIDMAGKRAASRAAGTALQQERAALSRQFDVPLTVGETRGSVGQKMLETQLERIPVVGIRGFRKTQGEQLRKAAEQLVDTLDTGVEDTGKAIQVSMLGKMQKGKDLSRQAYDKVEVALAKPGVVDQISPAATRESTIALLKEYPDIFDRLPAGNVKSKLAVIAGDTTPQTVETGVLDAAGEMINRTEQPMLTFKDARFLREQLGNYISRARRSAGAVGDKEIRRLTILKNSIDEDIKMWAESSPNSEVRDAFRLANKVYQRKVAPFKEFIVKKATGDEFDTDLMVKTFIKNDRPQLARKLMGLLDDNGKAAVKQAILKDAFELGTETKPDVPFSPAKFAGKLERYGNTMKSIFTPEELTQINGFMKISRLAERAGQFAENPPTGLRAGDVGITTGIGYGLATNPMATLGTAAATKFLSFMLTSNTGRRLLTRVGKVPEKSGAMRGLMRQFSEHVEKFKANNPQLIEQYGKLKDKDKQ